MMRELVFILFSSLTVLFSLLAVLSRNVVRGGISLLLSFVSLGALYFAAGAEFVGIIQVIVYGGAIVVLYLFALLTMDFKTIKTDSVKFSYLISGSVLSVLILLVLFFGFSKMKSASFVQTVTGAKELSKPLFFKFLLPFEVVSVLLLVATIGAVAIARRE